MSTPIVLLGRSGSAFTRRVAAILDEKQVPNVVSSQDAVFEGRPVTLMRGSVRWDGVDLVGAAATFLERPGFMWPQSGRVDRSDLPSGEREMRSLTVCALAAASEGPMLGSSRAAVFAASRACALLELAKAGRRVHGWRLCAAPDVGDEQERLIVDAVGGDHWHSPGRPPAGDVCLSLDPVSGAVTGALVIGGRVAAARRFASGADWCAARGGEPLDPSRLEAEAGAAAIAAAAALNLEIAEVWLVGSGDAVSVLLLEAGPDHEMWDRSSDGQVATCVAARLTELASRSEGGNR